MSVLDTIANDTLQEEATRVKLRKGDAALVDAVTAQQALKSTDYLRDSVTSGARVELAKRMLDRGASPDTIIAIIDGEPLTVRLLAQTLVSTTSTLIELLIQCGSPPALIKQAMEIVSRGNLSGGGSPVEGHREHSQTSRRDETSLEESVPEVEIRVSGSAKRRLGKMGVKRVQWEGDPAK
jgi:hypothetical protein